MRAKKRLTHKQKFFRNVGVILLSALVLWAYFDYPAPGWLRFRWAAQANLFTTAEYVGTFPTNAAGRKVDVGVKEGEVLFLRSGTTFYPSWPRGNGPTLCPIQGGETGVPGCFLGVDIPEGTARATLTAKLNCWHLPEDHGRVSAARQDHFKFREHNAQPEYWEKTYTVEGKLSSRGAALFPLMPEDDDPNSLEYWTVAMAREKDSYDPENSMRYVNADLEAVFYNSAGEELGRASLKTPA